MEKIVFIITLNIRNKLFVTIFFLIFIDTSRFHTLNCYSNKLSQSLFKNNNSCRTNDISNLKYYKYGNHWIGNVSRDGRNSAKMGNIINERLEKPQTKVCKTFIPINGQTKQWKKLRYCFISLSFERERETKKNTKGLFSTAAAVPNIPPNRDSSSPLPPRSMRRHCGWNFPLFDYE